MPRTRKPKRSSRTSRSRKQPAERGPDVPHWLPAGTCWEKLPETIREAVSRFVAPAYRRFVLDAQSEIERAIGTTLVHLMWLELCGQVQMAQAAADPESLDALLQNPEEMTERHLRLASVKCQTAELMVKLRVINDALERSPAPRPVLPAPLNLIGVVPSSLTPEP